MVAALMLAEAMAAVPQPHRRLAAVPKVNPSPVPTELFCCYIGKPINYV
jgi:hypothetical protein